MKLVRVFCAILASYAVVACGGSGSAGSLHLKSARSALMANADVASMFIRVLGEDNAWAGIQGAAYKDDATGGWSFEATGIPAGHVLIFAEARDKNGQALFRVPEQVRVEIKAHRVAEVTLVLQEVNPAQPFSNTAPFITSLTTTAQDIDSETEIEFAATVSHDDSGVLTYQWSDGNAGGTFTAATELVTMWKPAANGTFDILFSVTDPEGSSAALGIRIEVADKNGKGGVLTVIDFNSFPVVQNVQLIAAQPHVGQPLQIFATVHDLDGDFISYQWASTCGTIEGGANVALLTPSAQGPCVVSVAVADFADQALTIPRGGSNHGSLTLTVGETLPAIGPQFYVIYKSPVVLHPDQRAELQVLPIPGTADPWKCEWSDGGFGGHFDERTDDGFTDGSDAWYTAPTCGTRTGAVKIPISVVVTDTATNAHHEEALELTLQCPSGA